MKGFWLSLLSATVSGLIVAAFAFYVLRDPNPSPPALSSSTTYLSMDSAVFSSLLRTVNTLAAADSDVQFNEVRQTLDVLPELGMGFSGGVLSQTFLVNESADAAYDVQIDIFNSDYAIYYERNSSDFTRVSESPFEYRIGPNETLVIFSIGEGFVYPEHIYNEPRVLITQQGWSVPTQLFRTSRQYTSSEVELVSSRPMLFIFASLIGFISVGIFVLSIASLFLSRYFPTVAVKILSNDGIALNLEAAQKIREADSGRFEKIEEERTKLLERWGKRRS